MANKENYEEFVEKFKVKHTTDDCYTPEAVYDAVADWVSKEYGAKRFDFVRPFYPNGDYQKYPYKPTDIVVDNPPFSIFSQIVGFYLENSIKFFLFAHNKTILSGIGNVEKNKDLTAIIGKTDIIYTNGAKVNTAFVTNMNGGVRIRTAPNLFKAIEVAQKQDKKTLSKFVYPDELITFSSIEKIKDIDFAIDKEACVFVRRLDSQVPVKKAIYGGGFLISPLKAVELKQAELKQAELKCCRDEIKFELSDREKEIINNQLLPF